jgi:large subunit ribosomal protein L30
MASIASAGGFGGVVPPAVTEGAVTMAQLKVTQIKSKIGGTSAQRNSLRSLGLHRIGQVVVRPDRPEFRGMIKTVRHLVTVEEVD